MLEPVGAVARDSVQSNFPVINPLLLLVISHLYSTRMYQDFFQFLLWLNGAKQGNYNSTL